MREKEKLLELRKKVAEQQDHLKKLEDHMYVPHHFHQRSGANIHIPGWPAGKAVSMRDTSIQTLLPSCHIPGNTSHWAAC
jgi:hypothetical protein